MIRKRVVVTGVVQGVYYRDMCRRVALRLNVTGWVRNRRDRSVEAAFEGEASSVGKMVEWAGHGPELALVESMRIFDEQPEGLSGFEIRPTG